MTEFLQKPDVVSDNGFPTAGGSEDSMRLANLDTVRKFGERLPYDPANPEGVSLTSVLPAQVTSMPEAEIDRVAELYATGPFIRSDGSRPEKWTDSVSIDPNGSLLRAMPKTWEEIQVDLARIRTACGRAGLKLVPDDYFQVIKEDPSMLYGGPSAILGRISYLVGLDGVPALSYLAGPGAILPDEPIPTDPLRGQYARFNPHGQIQSVIPESGAVMREDPFTARGKPSSTGITTVLKYTASVLPYRDSGGTSRYHKFK